MLGLIQHSALVRGVRALLVGLDAAASTSMAARLLPRAISRQAIGAALVAAAAVHAAIVSVVPPASAPAGRYAFAIGAILVGLVLARVKTPTH